MSESLAEAFPHELARARMIAEYRDLGPAGAFGALMIEQDIAAADRAAASGDVVEMIRCYQTLREIK